MQAIILAAGMGKRLKYLTADNTKCMVKVNGISLIERVLRLLDARGLSRIVIVTGYEGAKLRDYIASLDVKTDIEYVDNPVYDRTNNIYSLSLATDYLEKEDTLLLESDVIFGEDVLDAIINDPRDTLALVDKYESWMDGTCLKLDDEDRIIDFISGKDFDFTHVNGCYKTVNIYKFSRHFSATRYIPFMKAYLKALGENEYYEQVLRVIAMLDDAEIRAKRLNGQKWYEIDDEQDLDIAETLFDDDIDDKIHRMQRRYGGYWRFPELLDYCYLVNPYYPPRKMMDEIKASFDRLITQYPSGMEVNSLLAAKYFGLRRENIVVGNGAAELIKSLMNCLEGKKGVIRPTFEEYPNRCEDQELEVFETQSRDFRYTADDVIGYFGDKGVKALILINPDNPTGNYIKKEEIMRLITWASERNIKLVLDESFADFSDEPDNSALIQGLLEEYRNLYVVKSISKSYGVPGLRLGILASGDKEQISVIKKDVAIWNINSFAEFYMQIAEKYKKDYAKAMDRFRTERKRFVDQLEKIDGIRVLPTQANYVMAELTGDIGAGELVKRLMNEYSILIKDLSEKVKNGEYVRIAIRSRDDNERLIEALKALCP